jgi:uncharacterized protein
VDSAVIQIEIVLALPERTLALALTLAAHATVAEALEQAGRSPAFSGVDLDAATVGIFGRIVNRDQSLRQGDRVEVYRPLAADPKTARRKRVASRSGRS